MRGINCAIPTAATAVMDTYDVDIWTHTMWVLKGYPDLKGSAVRSIERMLASDKELLKMNGGVAILLPYSDADRHTIYSTAQTRQRMEKMLQRVQAVAEKVARGEKLTAAERTFKSRHGDLFK